MDLGRAIAEMPGIVNQVTAASAASIITILLCTASPSAWAQIRAIEISDRDLGGALSQLARSANIELLFDQSLVAGKRAPQLHDANSPRQALDQLLTGTGLSYRQTALGTFVIFPNQSAASAPASSDAPAPSNASTAIEEILIVGHITQNTDIPRSVDDIQPYQIAYSTAIADSQSATVEDFLRTRLPSNAQAFALNQAPLTNFGSTRSQIDLRGLGVDQTLVLIDGRRLPSIPNSIVLTQPDLNGLSLGMIDRIETLGTSAGGIFGIGAAAGVVNVVLKRDFEGAEFEATNGISARGDAWHWGVGGRLGYSNRNTGTRVMIRAGHSQDDGLEFGNRDFVLEARKLRAQRLPNVRESVASPSINFNSIDGTNLTLIPALGGGSLNAPTTFLPINAPPVAAGGAALLKANAGSYDIALSPDAQGTRQSLLTPTHTNSFLATVRQDFSSWLEAYLDFLWLQDDGRATVPGLDTTLNILHNRTPGNPFQQTVAVSFPAPNLAGKADTSTVTDRVSAGIIVRFGGDWSATFDAATGQSRVKMIYDAVLAGDPLIDATLGLDALTSRLKGILVPPLVRSASRNQLNDFNLRLGGPLFQLPGGPMSLTATGEFFQEIDTSLQKQFLSGRETDTPLGPSRREVSSLFFEARAPLLPTDSELRVLRGLELQLALRADRYHLTTPTLFGTDTVRNGTTILAETLGARITPIGGLMLRASVATGFTPPSPTQILEVRLPISYAAVSDPQRGGSQTQNLADRISISFGGSPSLRPQQTISYSTGAVIQPLTVPGLRLSIDYTALNTTREITGFAQADFQYFIDHEALYPDRVSRAPLTAADAALGFTAGKITAIDAGYLQVGRSLVQSVDLSLDYLRVSSIGTFHAYLGTTWEPSFHRRSDPQKPSFDLADHADGPLSLRGNTGVEWSQGNWSTGLNMQFYGSYSGYFATPITTFQLSFLNNGNPVDPAGTNSAYIPAKVYFDWILRWRSALHLVGSDTTIVEFRFGIKNLLDSQPSVVAGTLAVKPRNIGVSLYDYNPLGGYSPYGDARGRRFEMSVSTIF